MRRESDVVFGTVVEFASRGILLLPVHDSVVCPVSVAGEVERRLVERFKGIVGVTPRVSRSVEFILEEASM
jgi:hypothetical protein